jgi:hypothetical protein
MIQSAKTIIILFTGALILFHSCKTQTGHNKYREAKIRPSERQIAQDKKILKKGNKAYKKQMRSNRKHLFGRSVAPH